jgi:hypothetical protein
MKRKPRTPAYHKQLSQQLKQIVTYGLPPERVGIQVIIADVCRAIRQRRKKGGTA